MIPVTVRDDDGIEYSVKGHFVRGQFIAVSVRLEGTEIRNLLAVTGRLREIELFVEWKLATAPI